MTRPDEELARALESEDPDRRARARQRLREAVVAHAGDWKEAARSLTLEPSFVLQWLSVAELPESLPPSSSPGPAPIRSSGEPPPLPSSHDLARASGSPFDDFRPRHREPLEEASSPPKELGSPGGAPPSGDGSRQPSGQRGDPGQLPGILGPPALRSRPPTVTGPRLPPLPTDPDQRPRRLALILHAHLPWVLGHGTWPHGEDWLMEAVVHCYVPLVAMLRRLGDRGHRHLLTFSVTPVLGAQLADPRTRAAIDEYYQHRLAAAEGLEKHHPLGNWWTLELARSRADWEAIDKDLVSALRRLEEDGVLEISTSAATHAYLPLTQPVEQVRFQLEAGCHHHEKLFGRWPRGIWMPECAYRPAGPWRHPATGVHEPFRPGNESFLEPLELRWTVVDAHLVLGGEPFLGYGFPWVNDPHAESKPLPEPPAIEDSLSRQLQPAFIGRSGVVAFVREPYTARQVWARHLGYPGDPRFLDFHKRHEASGLRLWSVTDADADLGDKLPYWPHAAADAVHDQAEHFLTMLRQIPGLGGGVAACPFDAELFGHWWYEGPRWLEAVLEGISHHLFLETTTPERELGRVPDSRRVNLQEGSWGEEGDHRVWLNPDTEWIWGDLQSAGESVDRYLNRADLPADRKRAVLVQLMLMASSDWPFLITMKAAADYARDRFTIHRDRLAQLLDQEPGEGLPSWARADLETMGIDPTWWTAETHTP